MSIPHQIFISLSSNQALASTSNGVVRDLVPSNVSTERLNAEHSLGSPKAVNSTIVNSKQPPTALNVTASPAFQLTVAIIASGFIGYFLNPFFDLWTTKVKARRAFIAHIADQIEKHADGYFLMSNCSYLLADYLIRFIQFKSSILPKSVNLISATDVKYQLESQAEYTSKNFLFYAGFLFRVMTDYFWIKGGTYFLPDIWGSSASTSLHNNLMNYFTFDENILLGYITNTKSQKYTFFQKLKDNKNKDLHDEYAKYKEWVLRQDKEVKGIKIRRVLN